MRVIGIIYFIDPHLRKNKSYYSFKIRELSNKYKVDLFLYYGRDFFVYLKLEPVWDEIENYIKKWRAEIPDFPDTNFDINYRHSFEEIKEISPILLKKLLSHDEIFNDIVLSLFPTQKTLILLYEFYKNKNPPKSIDKSLINLLARRLKLPVI